MPFTQASKCVNPTSRVPYHQLRPKVFVAKRNGDSVPDTRPWRLVPESNVNGQTETVISKVRLLSPTSRRLTRTATIQRPVSALTAIRLDICLEIARRPDVLDLTLASRDKGRAARDILSSSGPSSEKRAGAPSFHRPHTNTRNAGLRGL